MRTSRLIIAAWILLILFGAGLAAEREGDRPDSSGLRFSVEKLLTQSAEDSSGTWIPIADGVQLLYFHRTIRCSSCLGMEQSIETLLQSEFSGELTAKRLQWRSLDYEAEANSALRDSYQVHGPSLILAGKEGGKIRDWRRLSRIWEFESPGELDQYLKHEILAALSAGGQAGPDSSSK